ncbi:MAG: bacteriocin biosynthesis protein SagD, partial [Halobacteriales archaeon]
AIGPDPVPTGQAALTMLTERLANNDLSVYGARLTPRDVDALGFEAVRVLVPTAQPLFTGERYFGTRAREVPKSLGFQPRLDREPHPYP